jgi:hypothetical protein
MHPRQASVLSEALELKERIAAETSDDEIQDEGTEQAKTAHQEDIASYVDRVLSKRR